MCGFVVTIGPAPDAEVPFCLQKLKHRGPDASGTEYVDLGYAWATVGAVRLQVVGGAQPSWPCRYDPLGIVLAFNGEIYNWRELRDELWDGTGREPDCDAEILALGWRKWGKGFLDRLNGMFAFVLVDTRQKEVFAARDRAGEKPIYFTRETGAIAFASEIKALPLLNGGLRMPLSRAGVADADVLEYDALESTRFRGVSNILPGHHMSLRTSDDIRSRAPVEWWKLPHDEIDLSPESAVEVACDLVEDAVRLRGTDRGVPATVLVSGGLDSAIVQAVLKRDRVYCVTFPEVPALDDAALAAQGAEVIPITFDLAAAQEALPEIAWHLDTPATWSALGHWFAAKQIAKDGGRVVISGEGADELFLGYSRYRALFWLDKIYADKGLEGYRSLVDKTMGDADSIMARSIDRSPDARAFAHALELVRRYSGTGPLSRQLARVEWHTTMQVLLRMADRMTAAHSLENRSPFLDYRLIEFAARLPAHHLVNETHSKVLLRRVAERLGVPVSIAWARTKRGLIVPWNAWRSATGARGAFDRADFSKAMEAAWESAFEHWRYSA